ncbi:MAG: phosphopyruvate hydratase [Rhodospirillaceae bacterium]|nr:phosphopyruvate hydratase [Rhodospirillaceae bacterium]
MTNIVNITAREILDSRGQPTVEVDVTLGCGAFGRAIAPSGASKGSHEALEKRDEDPKRYNGRGVQKAVSAVNDEIFNALSGMNSLEQKHIDNTLIEVDGTENKNRLGANSILAVSIAISKAASNSLGIPLYKYIGGTNANILPVPMMNILNGGVHANNSISFQEFMIMPISATNIRESIRMGAEIFHELKNYLSNAGYSTNIGDEGGFAPNLKDTNAALNSLMLAIEKTGLTPGVDVVIAIDAAASELYSDGKYSLTEKDKSIDSDEMIEFYQNLVNNYPIVSIEDGLAEDDWVGWSELTKQLGHKIQLVGDDLFATNIKRLSHGITESIGNSILIKLNQIGTLSETLDTIELAKRSNYSAIVSHRSGESEDTTIADLAVATNCGQIKTGSLSRADRTAKYNQLIRIEEELDTSASFAGSQWIKNYM